MHEVYVEAMEKKKKYYAIVLAMLFGFLMIGLLAVVLDLLLSFSTIIIFPFLILPYFIAMQMMLIQIDMQEFNRKNFRRMFIIGLSPLIRRSFSVLKNILFAVLIYIAASYLAIYIIGLLPNYNSVFSQLTGIVMNGGNVNDMMNSLNEFMSNDDSWKNIIFISSSISYGCAFLFFVYKMLHNALYVLCKTSASLPNGKNRPVFKDVFKKYSKDYYKTYYKHEWYKVALVPLFYIVGVVLAYFLDVPQLNIALGTALSLVAIVILLPNLLTYQEKTYVKMFDELSKNNFSNMQKVYSDLKGQANLTKEQENALEDFMKQLENAVKEKQENSDKENKSSDE